MSIASAEIELQASALPTGSGFSGPLLDKDAHGTADLLFTASDPGAPPAAGDGPGVHSVAVAIDGTTVFSGSPDPEDATCTEIPGGPAGGGAMFDAEQPCPTETTVDVPVNTTTLADGGTISA